MTDQTTRPRTRYVVLMPFSMGCAWARERKVHRADWKSGTREDYLMSLDPREFVTVMARDLPNPSRDQAGAIPLAGKRVVVS